MCVVNKRGQITLQMSHNPLWSKLVIIFVCCWTLGLQHVLCTRTVESSRIAATGSLKHPVGNVVWSAPADKSDDEVDDGPDDVRSDDDDDCEDPKFRKGNLKLIKEMPFIGLMQDLDGHTKFEASGATTALGYYWAIFDNLGDLARVEPHFNFRSPNNLLIGDDLEDSQFEGLTFVEETQSFLVVQESHEHKKHGLIPMVYEIKVTANASHAYTVRKCPALFKLTHDNKGFEDIHYFKSADGKPMLMGLCEGNWCVGGSDGKKPGHGRIVVMELKESDGECQWAVVKIVRIPRHAYFVDYADLAFYGNMAAIVSQENASVWLGEFDFQQLEFVGKGKIKHFPRDHACQKIYCNVEGISWLDDVRVVITSDKAKKDQPYHCTFKDQMISIFAIT